MDSKRHVDINISAIPVVGVGGLGLVGLVLVFALSFPIARVVLVSGFVAGAVMAALLARRRRRDVPDSPGLHLGRLQFRHHF